MKKFSQNQDLQHDSTKFAEVVQLDFLQRPNREKPAVIADSLIYTQPDRLAAFRLAQIPSRKADKEFYGPLDIDKGTWSRIQDGDANFPMNKYFQYLDICENNIPLQYDAYKRGFLLVPIRSEVERELEEAKAEIARLRREREIERDFAREIFARGGK